jgi:hypothetical protein
MSGFSIYQLRLVSKGLPLGRHFLLRSCSLTLNALLKHRIASRAYYPECLKGSH